MFVGVCLCVFGGGGGLISSYFREEMNNSVSCVLFLFCLVCLLKRSCIDFGAE